MFNQWLKFNQLLLPQTCLLCTARNGGQLGLCDGCLLDMPWHSLEQCPQCALPSLRNQLCGSCLSTPPHFDATQALFRYEYPLDRMLQHYKYRQQLSLGELFGQLFARSLLLNYPAFQTTPEIQHTARLDCIIPMPLHPQRLAERGFNQALEIARVVGRQLGMTVDTTSCCRIKLSPPQASLPFKQRIRNMHRAFHCDSRLDGKRVALLDDVMTTGASLNALANTVKKAGASHVECWVIARTLPT